MDAKDYYNLCIKKAMEQKNDNEKRNSFISDMTKHKVTNEKISLFKPVILSLKGKELDEFISNFNF